MQFECPIISIKIPKIFIFLSHKAKIIMVKIDNNKNRDIIPTLKLIVRYEA